MTGASKILTVSYGTFSCTLEGFDEPFSTMKAIAEYFRDLAADDRYFGAEPPTPDAAMLHRIAEREVQRRVEAKVQENGIVLRAGTDDDAPEQTPVPAAVPVAPRLAAQTATGAESVAEKLSRLRADVAEQAAPDAAPAAPVQTAPTQPPAPAARYSVPDFIQPDFGDDEDYDLPTSTAPSMAPASVAPPAPAAVTGGETGDTQATDALVAGLMADLSDRLATGAQAQPAARPIVDDRLSDILASLAQDSAGLTEQTPGAAQGMAPSEAPALRDDGPDIADPAKTDAPCAEAQDDRPDADLAAAQAPFVQMPDDQPGSADLAAADPVAAPQDDLPQTGPAHPALDDLAAPLDPAQDSAAEPAAEPELRADASDKLQRARARVIRIRRSDLDAPAPATTLSAEAEADLAAELAALAGGGDPVGSADPHPAFAGSDADETISRLMAQADEQLEGPENKRRLSAIAHLKAAVAATVAERRASGAPVKDAEPSRLSRYRDDLARAVRAATTADAPQTDRPAPLVLVSEQRIDRPRPVPVPVAVPVAVATTTTAPAAPQPSGAVMPRRMGGSASLAFAQDDEEEEEDLDLQPADPVEGRGFAEFAGRLGAVSLGDRIEAAAAYLSCVEGREQFTRPQLMALVQAAMPGQPLAREDSLRCFGTLLRGGQIQKIRRGQFALSETSGYLSEGRRIAG